jgi:biopolymer transport protein ExbD
MQEFVTYELKSAAVLAVFYLFFKVLLSRESYHRLNRLVLLATATLSFVLPLCVITIVRVQTLSEPMSKVAVEPMVGELTASATKITASSVDWWAVALWVMVAGALAVVVWSVASVVSIRRLMASSRMVQYEGARLFVTEREVVPFSWFGNIILSERDLSEGGDIIITHEQAHQRLYHSVDVLFMNLCCALQWFNPAAWLLRRDLRELHEYEADEAVLCSGVDAKEYQLLLIRKAVGNKSYSIANSLNHSTLKNRITMMLQKKSTPASRMRVLYALPLVCLSLTAFAETETIVQFDDKVTENISEKQNPIISLKGEEIYFNDKRVSLEGLAEELATSGASPQAVITILTDESVKTELVTDVKEVLRKCGYLRIDYDKITAHILPPVESSSEKVEIEEAIPFTLVANREEAIPFTLVAHRNIMLIKIEEDNSLSIECGGEKWRTEYDTNEILNGVKTFVKNPNNSDKLSAKEPITLTLPNGESRQFDQSRGIIVMETSGKADFSIHKQCTHTIYRAYNDLRDELAREWFGRPIDQLSTEELEVIFRAIPINLAEANQK